MENMETPLADAYLSTLNVDENRNWCSKEKIQDEVNSIPLSKPPIATPSNTQGKEERVQQLRVALHDLKDKPTKSLKGNIQD